MMHSMIRQNEMVEMVEMVEMDEMIQRPFFGNPIIQSFNFIPNPMLDLNLITGVGMAD